ncbi:hypothetical protein [Ruminococcus albus]|uniref:Uncharacterized protein n=1 Tax=Ruminococcus albus (strain ATCC 27210 / DSM 20455 / JCM 14654 / NCDO 2250 / 7) TaxID=697329 RepID=E6UIY5_RUMA7|nr:hypothetical protein [Ruminococcus albus]ADU22251.1 hypothetical protein Rumal_1753 [Ruminococcus albus 7 = DSM 20455]
MKTMISLITSATTTLTAIPAISVSAGKSEYSRWEKFLKYDNRLDVFDYIMMKRTLLKDL